MTHRVTEKQQIILDKLTNLLSAGERVTYRKLADACGMHLTYVYLSVLSLEKKGKIVRTPNEHASLRIAGCKKKPSRRNS